MGRFGILRGFRPDNQENFTPMGAALLKRRALYILERNIDRGRNETPDNPRRCAPFGAASAFAEAMEGLGKNIVRTEDPSHTTGGKGPKKQKSVLSPLIKEGRFHFSYAKQTEDQRKTPLTPTKKYSKIGNALRGTCALCERKVTAKKLTPHSACFIGF